METATNLPVPAWFDAQKILYELVNGTKTEDVAATRGVTKEVLSYHLRKHATEDWKEAQVIRELRRKEEAEVEIDSAEDMLQLKKAEVKLKSAQWSLERVCRRIYGDYKEPESRGNISINLHLGPRQFGDDAKVIDQTSTA